MRSQWIAVVLSVLFLVVAPVAAFAQDWVVFKVNQPAYFTPDTKNWFKLRKGMHIPNASWVHTGRRARLQLRRGDEFIFFSPNTLARLKRDGKGKTFLHQEFGKLLLDVEARNHRHFKVKTPHLAAVVKGTRFSVETDEDSASVSVSRGAVDVSSNGGGPTATVGAGQTASVNSANAAGVSVSSNGSAGSTGTGPAGSQGNGGNDGAYSSLGGKVGNDGNDGNDGGNDGNDGGNDGHGNDGHGNDGHGNDGHGNDGHGNDGHGNDGHGNDGNDGDGNDGDDGDGNDGNDGDDGNGGNNGGDD